MTTERHYCHWPGCTVEVEPQFFACKGHWLALPKPLRNDIWRYYRRGQEITKDPSPEYIAAARRALDWIYDHHPVQLNFHNRLAQGDDATSR